MEQPIQVKIGKEQIVEVATKEFNLYGYYGASMRRICREGNFTNGRLFYHFESKTDLFLACVEHCYALMSDHMARFTLDSTTDLEENLLALYDWQCDFWQYNGERVHLFAESLLTPLPELQGKAHACRHRTFVPQLKKILREIGMLYYPTDLERQAMLTGAWLTMSDYAYLGFGLRNTDVYTDMADWVQLQKNAFRKVFHMFLYGFQNAEKF